MTHPFHIRGDGPLPPLLAFRELSLTSLHFARRSFRSCQLFLSHQNEQLFTRHRLIGARYGAKLPGPAAAALPRRRRLPPSVSSTAIRICRGYLQRTESVNPG